MGEKQTYAVFDAQDRCLYVGQTGRGIGLRVREHEQTQKWGDEIARWMEVREPEADAIRRLEPRYNIIHTPKNPIRAERRKHEMDPKVIAAKLRMGDRPVLEKIARRQGLSIGQFASETLHKIAQEHLANREPAEPTPEQRREWAENDSKRLGERDDEPDEAEPPRERPMSVERTADAPEMPVEPASEPKSRRSAAEAEQHRREIRQNVANRASAALSTPDDPPTLADVPRETPAEDRAATIERLRAAVDDICAHTTTKSVGPVVICAQCGAIRRDGAWGPPRSD